MDAAIVKRHWELIELVANHDYIPNSANWQVNEIATAYWDKVDVWCGSCLITMFKRIYERYKNETWL